MQRRHFLTGAVVGAVAGAAACAPTPAVTVEKKADSGAIQDAGCGMVPVSSGKYRVWIRRLGG